MSILEFCALTIAVSFTSAFAVGSAAIVIAIIAVVFGKDKDN
jgi:hypothetical protein